MEEVEKTYWSIGDVAKLLGTSSSAIRYWLTVIPIDVKRNGRNDRRFSKADVEVVQKFYFLIHQELYTIQGAKRKIEEFLSQRHGKNEEKTS